MDHEQNVRATKIVTSKEQQQVQQVIEQLHHKENINAFFVLSKFIDCAQVKNQPQFSQIIFNNHIEVVVELIQWMLTPKNVIKKKKIKVKVDSYPYQCRQFMKDNWCFYEQMYIAVRNKKLDFSIWFNFLRKQYYDKQTIYTALGYFSDVMIPFAKYQFSGSFNLTKSISASMASKNIQTLSIMKILPEELIDELIKYCYYEPIFQFLKTAILISIQDPRDYEVSKKAAMKILGGVKISSIFQKFPINSLETNDQMAKSIEYLQNISTCLKQLIQNIQPNCYQFSFRNDAFIQSILQSNIIIQSVDQLNKSNLCAKERDRLHASLTNPNQSFDQNQSYIMANSMQVVQGVVHNLLPGIGSLPLLNDSDQEQLVQVLLKILSSCVQIYVRIPKLVTINQQLGQLSVLEPPSSPKSNMTSKQKPKQITYEQYSAMIERFRNQMQYLLTNLQNITKLVYNQNENVGGGYAKIIPFSTGQNIKSISIMKHQFLKLLHSCLVMIQCKQAQTHALTQIQSPKLKKMKKLRSITVQPFEVKIEKLHPLQIIKKYLNQNRWNNLAHHTLQKICHLLIMCSYDYIKKNIQKDEIKKFSNSFLSYLIENFTKRDFIFLNTVKFTTQGNLHSLYNISKDLAYTLNSTNQLVVFLNQFQPWKKFIMTDLKNYEQSTFPAAIKPDRYEKSEQQQRNIKVDQVDSIKKLIQNIQVPKRWPSRKNKNLSKSGIYNFDKNELKQQTSKSNQRSTAEKQRNAGMGIQDLIRHKLQRSIKGKQVQEFNLDGISVRDNINKEKSNTTQLHKLARSTSQLIITQKQLESLQTTPKKQSAG